jgi:methionyl-tRNA synthetase
VAGIAGHYAAEALVGKRVVVVVNLEPAGLMGVESQGMVLVAEDTNGVRLLAPDGEALPGSRVK